MTTKDEALKLALEALDGGHIDRAYGYIQSALEQPAPATELREQEPAFYRHEDGHLMTPYRAKFLGLDLNELQPLYTSPPTLSLAQRQARSADTWVGLTDEERDLLRSGYQSGRIGSFVELCRAIEAKLKEKNT